MKLLTAKKLTRAMANASSYDEWKAAALAHDKANGKERWKKLDNSNQYDHVSVRGRLDRLRALRSRHDYRGLLFSLNEGIHGNVGGMGKAVLYGQAMFGTKQLIDDYVEEIVEALELLASPEVDTISFEEKLDFFRRAHHCFGCSAFMMSGSGALMFFHVGVIKALVEQQLLPDILSGSSGGAIVGSLACTHSDTDLARILSADHLAEQICVESRGLMPGVIRQELLLELIQKLIPDLTFEEAYARSGRALNVSISPAEALQTSRLMNAITSPTVRIHTAVQASAAVPGIFPPVTLEARDNLGARQAYLPSRQWVDGSMSDDLPAKRLARLYGVNHHIVSQTNPLVLPFLNDGHTAPGTFGLLRGAAGRTAREWINTYAKLLHRTVHQRSAAAYVASSALSLINQNYNGDINILPGNRFPNPLKLLALPTEDELRTMIRNGEHAAWPRMEMIRVQTKIGKTLAQLRKGFEDEHVSRQPESLAS